MDEYNSRYYKAYQMLGGSPYSDVNAYGGIDQVPVPYLSQDQIINSQDLTADVDSNVWQLAPIIAGKLRRLNPYASEDDIRHRTVDALGSIRTLMLAHATNQRQRHELLQAVKQGNVSNFTPEQIQQLQQMGVIDKNGKLVPGAHASAQASLSANFDDDKNQYPTVFTIASSAKPSETNLQAMASRSARTGVFDTNMFAPEYVPMYGATPPPPVAGVQAHLSQQGSISAGLSQPQTINIGGGNKSGPQSTITAPVTQLGINMIDHNKQKPFDADKIASGEQLLGLGVAGMKAEDKYIPELAKILLAGKQYTNSSQLSVTPKELETVFTNAKDNTYQTKKGPNRDKIKTDTETILKTLGIKDWNQYIDLITNLGSLQSPSVNRIVDFLSKMIGYQQGQSYSGDEAIMAELIKEFSDALNAPNDPNNPRSVDDAIREQIRKYQNAARRLKGGLDDPAAWQALYKLNLIASLDADWQRELIPDPGAKLNKQGGMIQQTARQLANLAKSPLTTILGQNVVKHIYSDPNFTQDVIAPQIRSIMINSINAAVSRAW
jgi:hypothetical protein